MSNQVYTATVIKTGRKIEVYKLKKGTPTSEHIWCDLSDCETTYTANELRDLQTVQR